MKADKNTEKRDGSRPGAFFPAWQVERANILQEICSRMELAAREGNYARESSEEIEFEFWGRKYANGKSMRLSASTLRRVYYRWCQLGRSRAAFELSYSRTQTAPKVDETLKLAFRACCERPEAVSFVAAYRLLVERWPKAAGEALSVSRDSFRRGFNAEEMQDLKGLFQRNRTGAGERSDIAANGARENTWGKGLEEHV